MIFNKRYQCQVNENALCCQIILLLQKTDEHYTLFGLYSYVFVCIGYAFRILYFYTCACVCCILTKIRMYNLIAHNG